MNQTVGTPTKRENHTLYLSALVLMCGVILFANFPTSLDQYLGPGLFILGLMAFVTYFSIKLDGVALSPAHAIVLMALLTYEPEAQPLMLWSVAIGSLLGFTGKYLPEYQFTSHLTEKLIHVIPALASVVLGYSLSTEVFRVSEIPLPLAAGDWSADSQSLATLFVAAGLILVIHIAGLAVRLWLYNIPIEPFVQTYGFQVLIILTLPLPFVVLMAEVAAELSTPAIVIGVVGLLCLVIFIHFLTELQQRIRRQYEEIHTLSLMTRTLRSHLGIQTLLKTIYLQVTSLLDLKNFTVVLVSEENRDDLEFPLVIRHGHEVTDTSDAQAQDTPLIRHVLKTETPLLLERNLPEAAAKLGVSIPPSPMTSWMGVPLTIGEHSMGVMVAASEDTDVPFTKDDLRLLNIVATSAGIAIENARFYHQQTERNQQLSTLNSISTLLTGTLSPDTVLDTIISSASTVSDAHAVAVHLFDGENPEELKLAGSARLGDGYIQKPPVPLLYRTSNGIPLYERKPLAISDVTTDERAVDLRRALWVEGKSALVEISLNIGHKSLGIVTLFYNDVRQFSEEQLEILRAYATQAAQAIQNARTFTTTDQALQRSLEQLLTLANMGQELASTMDIARLSEFVLSHTMQAIGAPVGVLILCNEANQKFKVMSHRGYPDGTVPTEDTLESEIFKKVVEDKKSLRLDDIKKDGEHKALVSTSRSHLTTPIIREGKVIGVIALESDKTNAFSDDDSHFLNQIASQSVVSIENARLFSHITEARDRLQVILDTMEEGIILIDSTGKVALANPRLTYLGLPPEKLLGEPINSLLADQTLSLATRMGFADRYRLDSLLKSMQNHSLQDDHETVLYSISGPNHDERYVQRHIIPLVDDDDNTIGLLLVFYDKTEEQELARARDEFSRMIVHDLRSPLTAVTTSLKLLHEIVPGESEFHGVVRTTTDASRRAIRKLLGRVDSLLDISKMQSGKMTIETDLTELATLADNVCVELSPLAQELEIRITTDIPGDLPMLDIDGDKVERLLINLVDNALKYSPLKSTITIRSHVPGEDGAEPGFVRVDVVDNGPGIPEDYKQRLFESFVQVEGRAKVRRGVGLGLTFCKLVAEAHGGRIWIEDNPVGGSIFAATLPVAKMSRLPEDEEELWLG